MSSGSTPATRRLLGSRNAAAQQQQSSSPGGGSAAASTSRHARSLHAAPEDLESNEIHVFDVAKFMSGSGGFSDWLDRDAPAAQALRKYRFAPELSKSGAVVATT